MKIKDIIFSDEFWTDWDRVPDDIQKRFNKAIRNIVLTKTLLPSVCAHKVKHSMETAWLGYVTQGNQGWRFLFNISSSGVLIIERLLDHDAMEKFLKTK
jgi:hypothetical protein